MPFDIRPTVAAIVLLLTFSLLSLFACNVPVPLTAAPEIALTPLSASDWTMPPLPMTTAPPTMLALERST